MRSAAAKAGKRVLHLDPADHYGSQWASLPLEGFLAWAKSAAGGPSDTLAGTADLACTSGSSGAVGRSAGGPAASLTSAVAAGPADAASAVPGREAVSSEPCSDPRAATTATGEPQVTGRKQLRDLSVQPAGAPATVPTGLA